MTWPTKQTEPIAVAREVSMYFRDFSVCALADVNLEIRRGEILGLIGPPGAGKTMLLKILGGRTRPTYGTLKIFGCSARRAAAKALTGYVADPRGVAKPNGFFRLPRAHPVGLAQVLLKRPRLLLLDEPLAGGENLKELLLSLRDEGRTIVLSGESLTKVKDICDRIALCHGGRVEAVGTLDELLALPQAVRLTAAVMPQTTLDRALQIIRHDLTREPDAELVRSVEPFAESNSSDDLLMSLVRKTSLPN